MNDLEFDIESLENRRMMAGDVSVRVTGGGDLRVHGDQGDNQVVIRASDTAGQFLVEGMNGTMINGRSAIVVENVTDDMRINLKGGDNALILTGIDVSGDHHDFRVPDDLSIQTGNGNDGVRLDLASAGDDIQVRTRGGEDAVLVFVETADRISVDTGSQDDVASLVGLVDIGSAKIKTGSGDDGVTLIGNHLDDPVVIDLGKGDDSALSFTSDYVGGLVLRGGAGFDTYSDANDSFGSTYGESPDDLPEFDKLETHDSMTGGDLLGVLASHTNATLDELSELFIEATT